MLDHDSGPYESEWPPHISKIGVYVLKLHTWPI